MTKSSRKTEVVEKVRESIIDGAVEIIHSDGFSGMTMRKIASRMEMSATNLYNYFSSKDDLYINILIRGFRDLHTLLKSAYDSSPDPVERSRRYVRSYLSFGIENFNYYEIMFSPSLPKYNDYVGTPQEALASVEMDYSKKIIELSFNVVSGVLTVRKDDAAGTIVRRLIEVWSMLHGMISLYNSTLIDYVIEKPDRIYDAIVDDIINYING